MISDLQLDSIREATDMVELVSTYVKLRKRGQHHVGLCPFHSEKTPSFTVNRERRIYHCFGCGRGGDAFKFLMEHERMGFVEAATYLAERAHIEIDPGSGARRDEAGRLHAALELACDYFSRALAHERAGSRARTYLESRRIPKDSVERFGVGYAPSHRRGLQTYAARFKVPREDLEAVGLLVSNERGTVDRFRDRLIFPIRTLAGKPIGFGGRDLSGDSPAKYLNSPETALYQKGRVLFGLPEAKDAMQKQGAALICEGYFDLLRLHEFGFRQAVAVSGTALTPEQARLLKRYVETVTLLFDADEAGAAAALRSVPVLFEAGLDVRIATLDGGDPDSFLLEHGASALETRLQSAAGYVEFLESRAGGSFRRLSPVAGEKLLRDIAAVVSHVDDPVRRDLLVQAAWSQSGIPEEHLRRILNSQSEPRPIRPAGLDARDWREELLCLLLARPDLRRKASSEVDAQDFELPLQRNLVSALFSDACIDLPASNLGQRELSDPVRAEMSRLATLPLDPGVLESAFSSYLRMIQRQRLGREASKLVAEIAEAERRGDPQTAARLSERHVAVRREWLKLQASLQRPESSSA